MLPVFGSQLYHLLAEWPWANKLAVFVSYKIK